MSKGPKLKIEIPDEESDGLIESQQSKAEEFVRNKYPSSNQKGKHRKE